MHHEQEIFKLVIDGIDDDLRVVNFTGDESISLPFKFTVEFICENNQFPFDELLAKTVTLSLESQTSNTRYINGIINTISQSAQDSHFVTYIIDIVPQVWLLFYRSDMRIFQDKTVEQIIKEVLQDAGFTLDGYEFSMLSDQEERMYCVQYQESDMDFISRLMNEEGIHYYFRHTEYNHTMIIADNSSVHTEIEYPDAVTFHSKSGLNDPDEFISDITFSKALGSNSLVLNDYNYLKPALSLLVESEKQTGHDLQEYKCPASYQTPEYGNKIIQRDFMKNNSCVSDISGESICRRFTPGYRFTLAGFDREDFNTEYLLTHVSHAGTQDFVKEENAVNSKADYGNKFKCVLSENRFWSSLYIEKPVISGTQSAVVTGPVGEDIYTDKYGRIKVKFNWDRKGKLDETSSCWLRVTQMSAGPGFGVLFIPRVGQEVIVSFEEGNPDRPIVTGCVYHGTNLPPQMLPDNKTLSTIKTRSSPCGEGYNELSFEDKDQQEKILLRAQKDMEFRIGNNKSEFVKVSSSEKVGLSKDLFVGGGYSLSVGLGMSESVVGDRFEKVVESKNILIGRNYNVKVEGIEKTVNYMKKISLAKAKSIQKAKDSLFFQSEKKIEFRVGSSLIKIDGDSIIIKSKNIKLNGKALNLNAKGVVNINGRLVRIN